MQSVIGAFELDDLVAPGRGAGQANRMHGHFGAAVTEAAHLDRESRADFFGEFPFHIVRHAEHGAGRQALLDGLHDRGMAVPGHERAEGQVVIDVFIAIEIAELAAAGLLYEDWPGIVSAIVAGDAEWNAFEIFLVRFGGLGRSPLEGGEFFLQIGIHRIAPGKLRPAASLSRRAIRLPGRLEPPGFCVLLTLLLEEELQCKLHQTRDP